MWDTVDTSGSRLSHDLPCADCGHAPHTYLACSDTCDCVPATAVVPAAQPLVSSPSRAAAAPGRRRPARP